MMNNLKASPRAPLLFTLGANPSLSHDVAKILDLPLSPVKVSHFADGEVFAKPLCEVQDRDCFILHSTFSPVSERLMDLLVFVDALKNASAGHITVLIPYFGYARQDRIIDPGDPISGLLVGKMLKTAGVDEIVTMDFHSLKLLEQFPLPHTNLSATALFAKRIGEEIKAENIAVSSICVVSPDCGGFKRAQEFAGYLSCETFACAKKSRPEPNKAQIESIQGEVAGDLCIIVDDIIDTAGTLSEVVKALYQGGAKEVWVAATHGIFSGHAAELIAQSGLKRLYVTNTIESSRSQGEIVSVAPLLADFIRAKIA
jgi:ribose-phosphate pyrophosphokinase